MYKYVELVFTIKKNVFTEVWALRFLSFPIWYRILGLPPYVGGLPWGANLEPFERPFLLVPVEFTLMYLPYLHRP